MGVCDFRGALDKAAGNPQQTFREMNCHPLDNFALGLSLVGRSSLSTPGKFIRLQRLHASTLRSCFHIVRV